MVEESGVRREEEAVDRLLLSCCCCCCCCMPSQNAAQAPGHPPEKSPDISAP